MMPEVEHGHHHHPTGHRWLDLALPVCALFVSAVSLVLAFIDGDHMQKMADANARLVEANSWPFLQYTTSNEDEHGNAVIEIGVINSGVGPAKLESFQVFWDGAPVASARDLLKTCCGLQPGQLPSMADAKGTAAEQIAQIREVSKSGLSSSQMAPSVIQAHQGQALLTLPLSERSAEVFQRLNIARGKLTVHACYCSVFDECWSSDLRSMTQQRVKACPQKPWGVR